MARHIGPVCRICRREGMKLFLKGTRCDTPKCAFERRESAPGMHTFRRRKLTDYGVHVREKQKVKRYYGVLERQFRRYFRMAQRSRAETGEALMTLLERRLDNVVHRLGFGMSRRQARQIVNHGHVTVNDERVDIASYLVRVGDVIRVKNRPKSVELVKTNLATQERQLPEFLSVADGDVSEGRVTRLPEASDVSIPVQTRLVIEICSR